MILSGDFVEKIFYSVLPEKLAKNTYQFFKCGIVGVLNTAVNFVVLKILMDTTKIYEGPKYTRFTGVAFCVAVINSYIWNKNWTFKDKTKDLEKLVKQALIFFAISTVGLIITIRMSDFVVNKIGPQWGQDKEIWAYIGNASAVFLTVIWNFTGYKLVVFRKQNQK
ncbi:MAG: GtrA family protein [bacterium]